MNGDGQSAAQLQAAILGAGGSAGGHGVLWWQWVLLAVSGVLALVPAARSMMIMSLEMWARLKSCQWSRKDRGFVLRHPGVAMYSIPGSALAVWLVAVTCGIKGHWLASAAFAVLALPTPIAVHAALIRSTPPL